MTFLQYLRPKSRQKKLDERCEKIPKQPVATADSKSTMNAAYLLQKPLPVAHAADFTCGANSNQRTRNQFRPRVTGKSGNSGYQLRQYAEATLGGGSLRKVVKLPEGEDENEWLAVNSEQVLNVSVEERC
jgi:hypothetical protein